MIERLIKIADFLDRMERPEDADLIDQLIGRVGDSGLVFDKEVSVPEDELEIIRSVYDSLRSSIEGGQSDQ